MKAYNTFVSALMDIAAMVIPIVVFVEKHSSFFAGVASILSIGWYGYKFVKSLFRKDEKAN